MVKMKKILIVEDEISYKKILKDQLVTQGYEIIEASDGKIGLELAKTENPDLIILDIKMPNMDGMTMLSLLRQEKSGKSTKIIMLTNLEPDESIITAVIKDQPTYYFIKSDVRFTDLLDKVKELLS